MSPGTIETTRKSSRTSLSPKHDSNFFVSGFPVFNLVFESDSMIRACPLCKSRLIEEDASRGDATCMKCGFVLEESQIVSEVQFHETDTGEHQVIGKAFSV